MKKTLLSLSVILVFALYIIYEHIGSGNTTSVITPPAIVDNNQSNAVINNPSSSANQQPAQITPPPTPTPTPTPPPAPAPINNSIYKDGTFTGSVADAYYGNIQVQAIIQNGKIVDVQFLQYPSDRQTSIRVNTQAMPYLKAEAIQAQSANVNAVSGATASSAAFNQSLSSALAQAKI